VSQQVASAQVPATVMTSTVKAVALAAAGQAAAGVISANVIALTEGVVKVMLLNRVKLGAVTLLLIAALGGGAVSLSRRTQAAVGDDPPVAVSRGLIHIAQEDAPAPKSSKPRPGLPKAVGEKAPRPNERKDRNNALAGLSADFGQDRPNSLDGLWEDVDNKGGWYRFQRNMIKWHPAPAQLSDLGRKEDKGTLIVEEWPCRYNPTRSPMTIDIFLKKGTSRGIFVVEGETLFIALAEKGKARPTSIQRDDQTTLLILKRVNTNTNQDKDEAIAAFYERTGHPGAAAFYRAIIARKAQEKERGKEDAKDRPSLVVHAVLESVDAKNSLITAEAVSEKTATSVQKLLSLVISDKEPDKKRIDSATEEALKLVAKKHPKLVNIPVRSDARITHGDKALQLKDLSTGRVVYLQLATDDATGLAIVGIQVMEKTAEKKH
jgi:hypothetical protein